MKTVGILTFAKVANFGANLQGLSTYSYFKNKGYRPVFIDWEPEDFAIRQSNDVKTKQGQAHFSFFDSLCNFTCKCRNDEDIIKAVDDYSIDMLVVGSDAVLQHHPFWTRIKIPTRRIFYYDRMDSTRLFPNPFWGTFYSALSKRIPMALMSGSSQNSPYRSFGKDEKKQMCLYLNNFSYISVRDMWTKRMVEYITDNHLHPNITPDPVFAFNQNVGEMIPSKKEILKKYNLPEQYCLISFLDQIVSVEWLKKLDTILNKKSISCVALPMPRGILFNHCFNYSIDSPLSPIDWYALIKYSSGYVGQNMHPIVVSLHNAVPFFSFDTYGVSNFGGLFYKEKSSKIYDVLSNFNLLQNRCVGNNRFVKQPSPEFVAEQLLLFDKQVVMSKSGEYYSAYCQMMQNIESLLL